VIGSARSHIPDLVRFMEESPKSSQTQPGQDRWAEGKEEEAPKTPPENPAAAAARAVPVFLAEIKAYGRHFLSAKADGFIARAKKIAIYAALGVVGLLVAAGIVFAACFLLLRGLATILGRALWHQYWLGDVLVGLLVLGGIALGLKIGIGRFTRASRLKTEQKYEGHRIRQRVQFGRDVRDRAEEARQQRQA
jgi:hypothetical protein